MGTTHAQIIWWFAQKISNFFGYAQNIDINTFRTSISAMHYARLKKWSHNLTSKSLTKKLCVYGPLEVCKILTREGHRCLRFYYKQKRKKLLNGASNTRENNTSPALYRHCRPSWKRRANSYDTGQQRRKLHQWNVWSGSDFGVAPCCALHAGCHEQKKNQPFKITRFQNFYTCLHVNNDKEQKYMSQAI